ncbi:MAG: glycosyltransferase family 39 protein [Proteobacteria bacterium]|nr:glycosyltransferase family 39 protein [Pseudomonadota bacterium]
MRCRSPATIWHWQWGNNKHPPLFGWIVAAWFAVFPATDNAYYLLNETNLAVTLFLLALALRRVLTAEQTLAAIVLTTLMAQFGLDSGFKYNANTALLPFIAGGVWALLKALQDKRLPYFAVAGLFAGAAVLCKYYALIILPVIGLVVAFQLRPAWPVLIKGGLLSGAATLLLVMPHVLWSQQHGWPSLHYMHEAHEILSLTETLKTYGMTLYGGLLFSSIAVTVWGLSLIRLPRRAVPLASSYIGVSILAGSILLTLLASWIADVTPAASWLIPALLFLGWALMDVTPAMFNRQQQARRILVLGLSCLALSLVVAAGLELRQSAYPAPDFVSRQQHLAADVTRLYHQTYHRPVTYVAGTWPLPYAMAFYSPDHPAGLNALDLATSYWIDPAALRHGNRAVICGSERVFKEPEPSCCKQAEALFGAPDKKVLQSYSVYDPKTKRLGTQNYHVLFWRPGRL